MIFERGWFIKKMNQFAPSGYKFVILGDSGRIALHSNNLMGNQSPKGPFVSCFSFDLLDTVYGGLLSRRSSYIKQSARASEYLMSFDIAKATSNDPSGKYDVYKSVILKYVGKLYTPYKPFIKKNALLIQALQESNAILPEHLAHRLNKYVNNAVWYAITHVMSSMPICDIRYYQDLYREKMNDLCVKYGEKIPLVDIEAQVKEKQYENLTARIEELKYDVLPKQLKTLERLTAKKQESDDDKKIEVAMKKIEETKNTLAQLTKTKEHIDSSKSKKPAAQYLGWTNGNVPDFSGGPVLQYLKMFMLKRQK